MNNYKRKEQCWIPYQVRDDMKISMNKKITKNINENVLKPFLYNSLCLFMLQLKTNQKSALKKPFYMRLNPFKKREYVKNCNTTIQTHFVVSQTGL